VPPVASAVSTRKGARQAGRSVSDDRARAAHAGRVLMVADGSGPTYGGYHAPIAMDPGLDALQAALVRREACDTACVRAAFDAANAAMYAFEVDWKPIFEEELGRQPDDRGKGLRAGLLAWQRVARARLGTEIATFAHPVASVTALVIDEGGGATVGQCGTARAYRCRGGQVEKLLPDQSLLSLGADRYYGVATAMLGFAPTPTVLTRTVQARPGDRFVLVTDGAWSALTDADIARACGLETANAVAAELDRAARDAADDVSIAVAVVSAAR
jgi:hypothetical protein